MGQAQHFGTMLLVQSLMYLWRRVRCQGISIRLSKYLAGKIVVKIKLNNLKKILTSISIESLWNSVEQVNNPGDSTNIYSS